VTFWRLQPALQVHFFSLSRHLPKQKNKTHSHAHSFRHARCQTPAMDYWDAFHAAVNPISIAARKHVPPGNGPGRRVVFAVDSSTYR
jgi:hypothetical protein